MLHQVFRDINSKVSLNPFLYQCRRVNSVADPYHIDTDPDPGNDTDSTDPDPQHCLLVSVSNSSIFLLRGFDFRSR